MPDNRLSFWKHISTKLKNHESIVKYRKQHLQVS